MLPTEYDEKKHHIEKEQIPEKWEIVDIDEINVRIKSIKWQWISSACHNIPDGKCVRFQIPNGYSIDKYMLLIRSSLAQSRETRRDKFSIRRSKFEDYIVVMRVGKWDSFFNELKQYADK